MRKDRLLKLADFLETKIPKRGWRGYFNLWTWAGEGWTERECGTTACAIGWATVAMPRSGLFIDANNIPRYGKFKHWEAVEAFMGLDYYSAQYLFSALQYKSDNPSPATVAKRIRAFVKNGGMP